ncbi:MAG TPA: PIN domain-containing protein [Caldithrix abyssi]|uniref:PIN domain-containing protein n=1 Tax=Caldithrix abyssi TaxID=187145 RepID=A0A7V4WW34_CALAY|nr:PIN domain-containing protein [Caldithrix abyssi]
MKGLDTNVLIRFLIGDDERQAAKVHKLFTETEKRKQRLFVPNVVILEMLWVLESVYSVPREDILDAIEALNYMPILEFENRHIIQQFLFSAIQNRTDLSVLLIAHTAAFHNCETVLTFDKKASKFKLFEYL